MNVTKPTTVELFGSRSLQNYWLIRSISHVFPAFFQIFGAYCSADWVERHKHFDTGAQISYFGTGQSFVFSIKPEVLYAWVGKNQPVTPQSASMFQAGDKSMIMIGGGNGCAIQVSNNLELSNTGGGHVTLLSSLTQLRKC